MDERFANAPWAWAAAMQMENARSTQWILSGRRPGDLSRTQHVVNVCKRGPNMSKHHSKHVQTSFSHFLNVLGFEFKIQASQGCEKGDEHG